MIKPPKIPCGSSPVFYYDDSWTSYTCLPHYPERVSCCGFDSNFWLWFFAAFLHCAAQTQNTKGGRRKRQGQSCLNVPKQESFFSGVLDSRLILFWSEVWKVNKDLQAPLLWHHQLVFILPEHSRIVLCLCPVLCISCFLAENICVFLKYNLSFSWPL